MEKKIGTILKLKNKNAIVMTRDCRIIPIKAQPGMYVGLEINFGENEVIHPVNKKIVCSGMAAGIAVLFLTIFTLLNFSIENRIFAYVDIDFTKSVEFAVDKDNKVLKVYSYDNETRDLLKGLDLKSKSVDTAIKEVMSKANKGENMILISACLKNTDTSALDNINKKEYEKFNKLLKTCKNAVAQQSNKIVAINYKYKELANDKEISMGRCFLYEKAKQQGVNIDMEEIKTKSIGETLEKVKIEDTGILHGNDKDLSLSKPVDKKLHDVGSDKLTDNSGHPEHSAAPENKLLKPHEDERSILPLPQENKGKPEDLKPLHQIKPENEIEELKEKPYKPVSDNKTAPSAPIEPKRVEATPVPASAKINDKLLEPPTPMKPEKDGINPPPTPVEPKKDGINPQPASETLKTKPEPTLPTPDKPKKEIVNPPTTPAKKNEPVALPTPVEHTKPGVNPPPTPAAKKNEMVLSPITVVIKNEPVPPTIPAAKKDEPTPPTQNSR